MEPIIWFVTPIFVTIIAAMFMWAADRRQIRRESKINRSHMLNQMGAALSSGTESMSAPEHLPFSGDLVQSK
jgi:hypothetical protein